MEQIWNWNNFRGGLSDNPYLGQPGQYQEGLNVDVQTEPNGFKLTAPLAQQISSVSTLASVIIDTSDYGLIGDYADLYTFTTYDGATQSKVYKGTSTTPYYTDATGSSVIAATAMWVSGTLAIYYFTGNGVIHKLTLGAVPVHSTLAGTFASGQTKLSIVRYGDDIYFACKNVFYKLDSVTETFAAVFTAGTENVFTGLTFFQDSFHIYSQTYGGPTASPSPRDGQQFVIRVGQTSPDYITKWNRLPILGACNIGSADYVVTGFGPSYSDLYVVSGTQRQLVKSNFELMPLGRKFTGPIVSWKDEVFLLGRNKDPLASTYGSSIFRLGKYFPGMPLALTEVVRLGTTSGISAIFAGLTDLYVGYFTGGGAYSVQKLNLDTPSTTYTVEGGYVVSEVFTGGDATIKKTLKEINISYMCDSTNPFFPHGGSIELYARLNPIDSWTKIGSTYTPTDIGNIRITDSEILAASFGYFNQIEYKCSITRGSTTLSPLVTGVKTLYDDNILP